MHRTYEQVATEILRRSGPGPAPVEIYPVDDEAINRLQVTLERRLHPELVEVWNTIGSGFFSQALDGGAECDDVNALLPPDRIAEIMQSEDWSSSSVPFFDIADGDYLAINERGAVIFPDWGDVVIASSVKDFVVKLADDPLFWKKSDPYAEPG